MDKLQKFEINTKITFGKKLRQFRVFLAEWFTKRCKRTTASISVQNERNYLQ